MINKVEICGVNTAKLPVLSSEKQHELLEKTKINKKNKTTFIFSTHDSRIVDMCDHVVHILDGQVINDEHKAGSDVYKI